MKLSLNNQFRTLSEHGKEEMGNRRAQVKEGFPETNPFFEPTENTENMMPAQLTNSFNMDHNNTFDISATNQSVRTSSPELAVSPQFCRHPTPTKLQRVSVTLDLQTKFYMKFL